MYKVTCYSPLCDATGQLFRSVSRRDETAVKGRCERGYFLINLSFFEINSGFYERNYGFCLCIPLSGDADVAAFKTST